MELEKIQMMNTKRYIEIMEISCKDMKDNSVLMDRMTDIIWNNRKNEDMGYNPEILVNGYMRNLYIPNELKTLVLQFYSQKKRIYNWVVHKYDIEKHCSKS